MVCLRLLLALLTWTHTAAHTPYLTIFSLLSYFSHSSLIRQQSLTKTTKRELAIPFLCKGGCCEDEGMGPLWSPWGGALPPTTH